MKTLLALFAALWLWSDATSADAISETPPAVSIAPGGIEGPTWISDPCPIFHWAPVEEAAGYELNIFQELDYGTLSYEVQAMLQEPVLDARTRVPVVSWSSTEDGCLQDGQSYFWRVRVLYEPGAGPWSEVRHFVVDISGMDLNTGNKMEPLAISGPPYHLNVSGNTLIQGALEIPGLPGPDSGDPVCSQPGSNGLLVACDSSSVYWGATVLGTTSLCANATCMVLPPGNLEITTAENCIDYPSETWLPTYSRTVAANCPEGHTAVAGGCTISNSTGYTYTKAVQIKNSPFGASWECAWIMPPSAGP